LEGSQQVLKPGRPSKLIIVAVLGAVTGEGGEGAIKKRVENW